MQAAVDRDLGVWCLIGNRTSVALGDIDIAYAWIDDRGQTRQGSRRYPGPLPAGKQDKLELGIKLGDAVELSRRVQVQVQSATVSE